MKQRTRDLKSQFGAFLCSGLAAAVVGMTFSILLPLHAYAGNWKNDETGWKYFYTSTEYMRSQWFQNDNGLWYYLDEDGNMMIDTVTPDGYRVGADGAWLQDIPQIRYPHIVPDETCNNHIGALAEPIFQVATEKPLVALTFDSGSNLGYTDEILDILDKYNICSTFFVTKEWADAHEDDVKKICERGHELGNHSVSHPDLTKLNSTQISAQIQETHTKIKELTGQEAFLFRTPFGAYNTSVVDTVKDNGYYCIQWTVDSLDWKNQGVDHILKRVLQSGKLKNGAIVLMHNGATYTPKALSSVIEGILAKGYQIVPVSELIYTRNYNIDRMGVQHSTAL